MVARKRIKARKPDSGQRIKATDVPNYDKNTPVFSLEKLQQGDYCLSALDQENKASFADAIYRRKSLTWGAIKQLPRHGLGTEKMPIHRIKAAIPPFITEDVTDFLVFRYHGMRPMVGYRQRDIFFVLWFDHDFTLYDH